MKRLAYLSAWCVVSSALAGPLNFVPFDIFRNDSQTRVSAAKNDIRWTVRMGGCTGSMLSTKYLLTANHCSPRVGATYTSGGCLELGCTGDLKVVRIAERNSNFDYNIVEMAWSRVDSRWRQRYTPKVQTREDEVMVGKDGQATPLFTVGFPTDKNAAMHATGYAKGRSGDYLQYNVASINGNSGGAIWKSDDFTLVSQTNHGPHQFGAPGWNNNDPENSRAWNGGPRMNLVYHQSAILKEIFPDGKNTRVSFEGYLIHDEVPPPLDP